MEDSSEIIQRFETFFREFIDDEGNHKYDILIRRMELDDTISLEINYDDLLRFDNDLARNLLNSPESYIEYASLAIKHRLRVLNEEYANRIDHFHARFKNLEPANRVKIRKLRSHHIGKLIQISGILTRVNKVSPLMTRGVFKCLNCNDAIIPVEQENNEYTRPLICPQCNRKGPFKLLLDRSKFIDWQKIRVQERPEELPAGQLPRFIDCYLTEDIVDLARPGDRVTIVGILKAKQESTQQGKLTIFRTYIEINHIEKQDVEIETLEITAEDEEKIKELAKDPWIHRKLIRSIAPSIHQMDEIKEAILLLLFSGVSRERPDGTIRRGEIHVLIIGDPGVGKSQLLKACAKIAPRGIYTSGKGSTAAGLTAAVLRDNETGNLSLEAGVLVLADRGVAAIDEFDKMRPDDRIAIHEAMEQLCYHPSTEILLTDGQRIKIGEYIDNKMENNKNLIINGINCQILIDNSLELYTTDFKNIYKTRSHRISRHTAPEYFYKIKFSNGRSIIVTPEHPIFKFGNDNEIICVPAEKCKEGDLIPIPAFIPNSDTPISLSIPFEYHKYSNISNFKAPTYLNKDIVNLLGLLTGTLEIHNNKIKFNIKNQNLIIKLLNLLKKIFNLDYNLISNNGKIYFNNKFNKYFIKWLEDNFSELINSPKQIRIPSKILGTNINLIKIFLNSLYECIGGLNECEFYFKAPNQYFGYDLQDLLLKIGILSIIKFNPEFNKYEIRIDKKYTENFINQILKEKIENNLDSKYKINNNYEPIIKKGKIIKVEKIKNEGEFYTPWVYDITIEPEHSFISQGVILHNTVSIAKAGIIATLNSRTSILAAANPTSGRYDPYKTVAENIKRLPPTILSRFDLIFLIQDRVNPEMDTQIADFILSSEENPPEPPLDYKTLKNYIFYARKYCRPRMTREAIEIIKRFYLNIRSSRAGPDAPVPITARYLEALIRLSEARAKMALKDEVTAEDAEAAIRLMTYSLNQVGIDQETGMLDVDAIETGITTTRRRRISQLSEIIRQLIQEKNGAPASIAEIIEEAKKYHFTEEQVRNEISNMRARGMLYEPRDGYYGIIED